MFERRESEEDLGSNKKVNGNVLGDGINRRGQDWVESVRRWGRREDNRWGKLLRTDPEIGESLLGPGKAWRNPTIEPEQAYGLILKTAEEYFRLHTILITRIYSSYVSDMTNKMKLERTLN